MFLFFVPGKLMAALAYRDDKILARNLLSHPFFCLTPAEPFFRPDRSSIAPSCRVAVKDGRAFRGHPKGLSLTAASTMARWLYRSGRRSCVAAEHASSPRRSSRLPGSRAVSTEVRELRTGSPSIISISRPSNCLLLLRPLVDGYQGRFVPTASAVVPRQHAAADEHYPGRILFCRT